MGCVVETPHRLPATADFTTTIAEIQARIKQFVEGEITWMDFQCWIIAETWDMHDRPGTPLSQLLGPVMLLMAEYLNGDWTEQELRGALQPFTLPVVWW